MDRIHIEKVTISEINTLQIICRKTFFDTYSDENTAEDMKEYLEKKFNKKQLTKELNNPNSEFYFAKNETKILGYLKLNFDTAQTMLKDKEGIEIERIYVLKEQQGKKIGQLLYNCALEISKEKKVNYIWLGVWEKNLNAIGFYKKNGFVEFNKYLFILGKDEQTDIIMKLNVKK